MDRHVRPPLQRGPTSGSLHGDQMLRASRERRNRMSQHGDERRSSQESRRQRSSSVTPGSPEGLPYACPYAKHDPETYSHKNASDHDYRNCSTGYWTSIARLKQHLYRTHNRSERCCQRCWRNFSNDNALREHVERRPCEAKPVPEDKMDAEQRIAIHERVQGNPFKSWYKIYTILFPEDNEPPSPYAEWVTGEDLRNCFTLLLNNLPRLLAQAAVMRHPEAAGKQLSRDDEFPTTADTIQKALKLCQKEFAQRTGLGHVFASGSSSPEGSLTSGSERGVAAAPSIRPNLEQPYARHMRNLSVNTQYARQTQEQDMEEESSSASSTDTSVDEQMAQLSRHGSHQHVAQRSSEGYPVSSTAPYTIAPYTAITTAPTDEDLLQAPNLDELFPPYGMGDISEYDYSQ